MKNFFVLAVAVLVFLVFMGCEEEIDDFTITNNSDYVLLNVTTRWSDNSSSDNEYFGNININSSSSRKFDVLLTNGRYIHFDLDTVAGIEHYSTNAGLNKDNRQFTITNDTVLTPSRGSTGSLKKFADISMLVINNQSGSAISTVIWNGIAFTNEYYRVINSGSNENRAVQAGSGYIYFERKTNPINARTDELVVIEKKDKKVFIINDNTLIVDVDNPSNKGTLGTLSR